MTEVGEATNGTGGPGVSAGVPGCVAVLGMHRGGTSATAGMLIGLGLAGPRPEDLVPADESNARGHWESDSVVRLNSRMIRIQGGRAFSPPRLPPNWEHAPELDPVRAEAKEWLSETLTGRPLMLKDPRLCLTLPLWTALMSAPVAAVLVLRDPLEVAGSIKARDDLPIMLSLAIWDRYMRSANTVLAGLPTLVVAYDRMLSRPAEAVESMRAFLTARGIEPDPLHESLGTNGLDPGLRHQRAERGDYDRLAEDQRALNSVLSEQVGAHAAWQPRDLPPEPPWVEDMLQIFRKYDNAQRELHWIKRSRLYRMLDSVWRVTDRQRPGSLPTKPVLPETKARR